MSIENIGEGYNRDKLLSIVKTYTKQYVADAMIPGAENYYSSRMRNRELRDLGLKSFRDFSEGFAAIETDNNKWFFINEEGEQITQYFDLVRDFSEGFAAVKEGDNWFFINKEGKKITQHFEEVRDFSEGLAAVKKEGEWFYINTDGERDGEDVYINAYSFKEGLARVVDESGISLINKEYEKIIEGLELGGYFQEDLAAVKRDSKWFFIDREGKRVTDDFESAGDFKDGYAIVSLGLDKFFFIDKNGNSVTEEMTPGKLIDNKNPRDLTEDEKLMLKYEQEDLDASLEEPLE